MKKLLKGLKSKQILQRLMDYKLYFFLIGCKLPNRHTEQHDVFFGVGKTPADLIPALNGFWPEAEKIHIDCWREVTNVNGSQIKVFQKDDRIESDSGLSLFFINMGGYKRGEFEEFHYKDIFPARNPSEAVSLAKKTTFYKQFGFKGAVAHIDNQYGVDIDEIYNVAEILTPYDKTNFRIIVTTEIAIQPDEIHLGYTPLSKLGILDK